MTGSTTRATALTAAVTAALTSAALAFGAPVAVAAPSRHCEEVTVPVAFDALVPADVHGTYCTPASEDVRAVQLLVHGATYDRHYWDQAFDYPASANAAGYATLAVDTVGYGESTHLPSATITATAQADALHQVVGALRSGAVGGSPAPSVVIVGHSVGSALTMIEAATYHDVDAVVLTSITHHLSPDVVADVFTSHLHPAPVDPVVSRTWPLDAGMLTTKPGERAPLFYSPNVGADAIAHDEATKSVIAASEAADAISLGFTLPVTRGITVPVFLMNGTADALVCAGAFGVSCATPEALAAAERPYFGPEAHLATAVVPDAGHSLTFEPNAATASDAINAWLAGLPLGPPR